MWMENSADWIVFSIHRTWTENSTAAQHLSVQLTENNTNQQTTALVYSASEKQFQASQKILSFCDKSIHSTWPTEYKADPNHNPNHN